MNEREAARSRIWASDDPEPGGWTAWLDSAQDPKPFYTGSEQGAKDAAQAHPRHDVAYVEDPQGQQFVWWVPVHPLTGRPLDSRGEWTEI